MNQKSRSVAALAISAVALVAFSRDSLAQTPVKSGFNVFSPEQDIEVGRQSAAEAERTLPLLRDPAIVGYVDRVGRRLAANAPGPKFPYTFKVVNASDINAFALPGGPVYVTRGIVDSVRNEGELAGVMAHEISHVALRHGTNQASKAYLTKAGIGILGGILGAGGGAAGTVIQAVGGLGMNALFLKFSRTAESQADILGTQIMARSGYDPQAMVTMFQLLQNQQARQPGRVAQFFSDHPNPGNREARVRQEAQLLRARGSVTVIQIWRMQPAPSISARVPVWLGSMRTRSSFPPDGSLLEMRRRRPGRAMWMLDRPPAVDAVDACGDCACAVEMAAPAAAPRPHSRRRNPRRGPLSRIIGPPARSADAGAGKVYWVAIDPAASSRFHALAAPAAPASRPPLGDTRRL